MGPQFRLAAEDLAHRDPSRAPTLVSARGRLVRLGALVCVLFASCGLPEGDGTLEDTPPSEPQIPLVEGQTVGELEVVIPNSDLFTLRGTLPVPKGVFDPLKGIQPFGVVDSDGETYGAQAEVVAWYPNDALDGAAVVEILARVSRGALPYGTRAKYRVVLASHPSLPNPGSAGVEDLIGGPHALPTVVQTLLSNPAAIEVRSYDCFGNKYLTYPLNGAGEEQLLRYGEHTAELRLYQKLAPAPPVSGATKTLDHFLGVHSYHSSWNSEEFVGFDIRLTNADSGNVPGFSLDDPLDKVYFKSIEIAVPNGWVVVQDFDDPFLGASFSSSGMTVLPLVKPLTGNKLHLMPWGWQFHRRLAICRVGQEAKAREFLRGAGLGFCRVGMTPEAVPYWSWWNTATARYWPQAHILPIFDHLGQPAVAAALVSERNKVQGFLEGGGTAGDYPVDLPVLGWSHPYGIAYGGMTGGAEVNIFDGMQMAWAAEIAGYQQNRIVHRMQSDRQHNLLINWDGESSSVEDWLKSSAAGPYVPFEMFVQPQVSVPDAFGLYLADKTHINYVASNNMQPDYESQMLGVDSHDYQHFIRYTHAPKVLAWLANDSVAKDDLRAQAENFKLAYHQFNNGSGGSKQGSGFASAMDFVQNFPGKGFGMGRGQGWGIDCSSAAYATSSRAWRAERKPWFDLVADNIFDGQAACSGFLMAVVSDKMLDGKFRARQAYEHSIADNAVRGMLETVYRGLDTPRTAMLESVLEDSYYALIGELSWGPGQHSPWQMSAVGPLDPGLPLYCNLSQLPVGGWTPGAYETFQNWSILGYAYQLTGDTEFLDRAALQIGGTSDLLSALEANGLNNIENKAGLLAILQHENGDF
jgi:hypothetical protein